MATHLKPYASRYGTCNICYLLLPPTAALLGSKAVLAIATWALEGEVDARVAADRVCLWDAVAAQVECRDGRHRAQRLEKG